MNTKENKVILLGQSSVGKTSLSVRFMSRMFNQSYRTSVGAACVQKNVQVNGKTIRLSVWDTAGSEKFDSMNRLYYHGAMAAVVCYDLTRRQTFDRAMFYINEVKSVTGEDCRLYLCGTKRDLVTGELSSLRQISEQLTGDFAKVIGAYVFETSSQTGENVEELFIKIAEDLSEEESTLPPSLIFLENDHSKKTGKSLCC